MANTMVSRMTALMARLDQDERDAVEHAESQGLGYAQARIDACEDHKLPKLAIEPRAFGVYYANQMAVHLAFYRDGRSTSCDDIRTAWERWITNH